MPRVTLAPDVLARFDGIALAWALVGGLAVRGPGFADALALQRAAEQHVRATRTADGLREDALFRAYRDFYWKLGIDPTKTRPSGEALNRRVLHGKPLPSVNAFVDAYNAASLATGVPIGAYDADVLEGPLALRLAQRGETFHGLGEPVGRALDGGEVVLADGARVVNFYPYRDADATRVTERTTRALLVACGAPGVERATLRAATDMAVSNVLAACGGKRVEGG